MNNNNINNDKRKMVHEHHDQSSQPGYSSLFNPTLLKGPQPSDPTTAYQISA